MIEVALGVLVLGFGGAFIIFLKALVDAYVTVKKWDNMEIYEEEPQK